MKKIKVAILFEEKIINGGGFVQSLNAALLTKEIKNQMIDFIYISTYKENLKILTANGLTPNLYYKESFLTKIKTSFLRILRGSRINQFLERHNLFSNFEDFLGSQKVDLVYFLSLSKKGLDLSLINYIVTIWDISHLDEPEFPETRKEATDYIRDSIISPILKRSTAIMVDSLTSKRNISKRFYLDNRKIKVLPYEASNLIQKFKENNLTKSHEKEILKKYSIKDPYIFYPAQFWSHKNHAAILYAIKGIKDRFDTKIDAVFSGSDKGNLKYILNLSNKLGIRKNIKYLGFVDDAELPILYKNSISLVMPSYFGPTNIPPLEALSLSVPIIYSDIPGAKEQLGKAAIYINLEKIDELSDAIFLLYKDDQVRNNLIQEGQNRLKEMLTKKDRALIVEDAIKKFIFKKLTWE